MNELNVIAWLRCFPSVRYADCGLHHGQLVVRYVVDTFERRFLPSPLSSTYGWVGTIQAFLQQIKRRVDDYKERKQHGARGNYEEIANCIRQLQIEDQNRFGNPASERFASEVRSQAIEMLAARPGPLGKPRYYTELLDKSADFIRDVVWHKTSRRVTPSGLDTIRHLAENNQDHSLDIVTLNHDCLIETVLSTSPAISYADGFGSHGCGVRRFDPASFTDSRVRLIKLHGSVDWFRWPSMVDGKKVWDYCCVRERPKPRECTEQDIVMPSLLIGTDDKISEYVYGLWLQLYLKFVETLKKHNLIVMSGYGWNDRGVNENLFQWLDSDQTHRILLLYEKPESLRDNSNSKLWHLYDRYVEKNQLVRFGKWFCDTNYSELLDAITGTQKLEPGSATVADDFGASWPRGESEKHEED